MIKFGVDNKLVVATCINKLLAESENFDLIIRPWQI